MATVTARDEIPQQHFDREPSVGCVAPRQSSWLIKKSVAPFQPATLHPTRRAFYPAGGEVNRCADLHYYGDAKLSVPVGDPILSFGLTESDKKQIGFSLTDVIGQ